MELKEDFTFALPKSTLETVSAFANTAGGHLVLGVKEDGQSYEILGVVDVDKIQGDFFSLLNSRDKFSVQLDIQGSLLAFDEKHVLVFAVPEAERKHKPVYLDKDIRKSFIRRGSGDQRCSGVRHPSLPAGEQAALHTNLRPWI